MKSQAAFLGRIVLLLGILPTSNANLFCQGCACESALKTKNTDGLDVCYTMANKARKTVDECEQECAFHGADVVNVGDRCGAKELALYVQQQIPQLTAGNGYNVEHAVYIWTDIVKHNSFWESKQGSSIPLSLWAPDYPYSSAAEDTHAALAVQLGVSFHKGSNVRIGHLVHADVDNHLVVAYNNVGVPTIGQRDAFCACQSRLPKCSLSDLTLLTANATGFIDLPSGTANVTHGSVPISSFSIEDVHVGTVVTMHTEWAGEYDVKCTASDMLGDPSQWTLKGTGARVFGVAGVQAETATTRPFPEPEPFCHPYVAFGNHTWSAALLICAENNGTLLTIHSQSMQTHRHGFMNYAAMWIGLRKTAGSDDWSWMTPGSKAKFRNWASDEPSTASTNTAVLIPNSPLDMYMEEMESPQWVTVDGHDESILAAVMCDVNCGRGNEEINAQSTV